MNTTWETPQTFFDALNREFSFTLDVAAIAANKKCERYFSPVDNALTKDWRREIFWMNPPYGRGGNVYAWVQKAFDSTRCGGTGVCLLPASVDTKWFHEYCMKADEIRVVRDRLWFSLNGKSRRANHASMIVIFRECKLPPMISSIPNYRAHADRE